MATNFVLFDIDGVIIKPYGYRQAVYDTTSHFLNELGLLSVSIDEDEISAFESIGITSEWDIVPIFLMIVIELTLKKNQHQVAVDQIDKFHQFSFFPSKPEIIQLILEIEPYLLDGTSACESIIKMFDAMNIRNLFPFVLSNATWVLERYLNQSRSIEHSPILQYFQNLILGSDELRNLLNSPISNPTESYLLKFDIPLIDTQTREIIKDLKNKNIIFPAIITARPSLNPDGDNLDLSGNYYPEAELALKRLEMDGIPYVGYGALQFLASLKGGSGDNYVKPVALHALSAILTSVGLELSDALKIGYDYLFNRQVDKIIKLFSNFQKPLTVTIFEDSAIGIKSVKSACEKLIFDGIEIETVLYGIAENKLKIESLKKENASIFPTINEAFSHFLSNYLKPAG